MELAITQQYKHSYEIIHSESSSDKEIQEKILKISKKIKTKKHAQTQKQNYIAKSKKQVISDSLKILFQPKSNFHSSVQSFSIYIKLCLFGFSRHCGFC